MNERKEWQILDSSKLSDYLSCPRMYFYRHILGWQPDMPAHDLVFGEAWHRGREHQLLNGYEDVPGAYVKFCSHYREFFDITSDDLYLPKDPAAALMGYQEFAKSRKSDLKENEVLYTETSGTVPIDTQGRKLYYRMDSIIRRKEDDKIFSWDHKSAKRFGRTWEDKFHLSIQNGTYTHCLYCMYPIDQVIGVEFCGTKFEYLKRGSKARPQGYYIELLRVPAYKNPEQMNGWLWTVLNLVYNIEDEMEALMKCKVDDPVLMCFPMNPESCTKYWGCRYHDYCMAWQNPLQRADEPPLGFKTEFWDPTAMDTTNKIDLEFQKGVTNA